MQLREKMLAAVVEDKVKFRVWHAERINAKTFPISENQKNAASKQLD